MSVKLGSGRQPAILPGLPLTMKRHQAIQQPAPRHSGARIAFSQTPRRGENDEVSIDRFGGRTRPDWLLFMV